MAVELQCSRCYQTVSFDRVDAGVPLYCPVCKELIPAATLAAAVPAPSGPDAAWWVSDAPPSAAPTKTPPEGVRLREQPGPPAEATVPEMTVTMEVAERNSAKGKPVLAPAAALPNVPPSIGPGMSAATLVLGVVAFALAWFPSLLAASLVLSGLGVLLAGTMLGPALAARRGVAFPLAVAVVNLQALVLATVFCLDPPKAELPLPAPMKEEGQKPRIDPP